MDKVVDNSVVNIGNLEIRIYSRGFEEWILDVERQFNPTKEYWKAIQKFANHLLATLRHL